MQTWSLWRSHLETFVGQRAAVVRLDIAAVHPQRLVTFLLGLFKLAQLQVAQGSVGEQGHHQERSQSVCC